MRSVFDIIITATAAIITIITITTAIVIIVIRHLHPWQAAATPQSGAPSIV